MSLPSDLFDSETRALETARAIFGDPTVDQDHCRQALGDLVAAYDHSSITASFGVSWFPPDTGLMKPMAGQTRRVYGQAQGEKPGGARGPPGRYPFIIFEAFVSFKMAA